MPECKDHGWECTGLGHVSNVALDFGFDSGTADDSLMLIVDGKGNVIREVAMQDELNVEVRTTEPTQSWGVWFRLQPPFVAGAPLPDRLRYPAVADFEALRAELQEPRLGLATTRQLLQELQARGELQNDSDGAALHRMCSKALSYMVSETLDYRTWDPQYVPECGDPDCEHAPDGGNHPEVGRG